MALGNRARFVGVERKSKASRVGEKGRERPIW